MKLNRTKKLAVCVLVGSCAASAVGQTTEISPNVYRVETGVDFTINNQGSSNYTFNWIDKGGNFVEVIDPTLILTAGETYTFARTTSSHPLRITDDTLDVTGTDGSYMRTTFDEAVIDAATLTPIPDFTADPAPTADMIIWDLDTDDIGDYYYTCFIFFHQGMTGRIEVVAGAEVCAADLAGNPDGSPDGLLNFSDVSAYLTLFGSGDLTADLAGNPDGSPDGLLNFSDVSAYLTLFGMGCP